MNPNPRNCFGEETKVVPCGQHHAWPRYETIFSFFFKNEGPVKETVIQFFFSQKWYLCRSTRPNVPGSLHV